MADAIAYARDGFEMHPFLWGEVFIQSDKIGRTAAGREIFFDGNAIPRPGTTLYQKEAADTLERLAEEGNDYFYRGDFAKKVCEVVQGAGGVLTPEDFERWEPRWQEPAWGSYRDLRIAGSPPPDNGGTHIIEMLHMLEFLDLEGLGPPTESAESLLQMVRISHLVYTEGGRQNDPESHPLPLETILSKDYAKMRFDLLQMGHPVADSGEPPPPAGSNHVTVVDAAGNVSTILHSCMSYPWSNGLFAGGVSICAAGAHFFRVMPRPGHRISAYVAPNIIFRGDRPVMASGSPSVSLLQNVLQNSLNVLQFGVPVAESVNRPRFGGPSLTTPGAVLIEADFPEKVREKAAGRGINFDIVNPWNWHHGSFEGIHHRRGRDSARLRRPAALQHGGGDGMTQLVLVLLAALLVGASALAQDTVLRCGAIFDGDAMGGAGEVVVRDGRIVSGSAGGDAEVVDLSEHTCLPGLIDLHAHLTINPDTLTAIDMNRSSAARALDALANARKMLDAGFTTLRTPGEFDGWYGTVDLKHAINRGQHVGPRLLIAPHAISATGGHGDFNNLMADLMIETPTRIADGPEGLRLEIRREFKYGADWIKLMMTGGVMSAGDDPNVSTYTEEEVRAAVEEVHRHKKKITVHAHGAPGINTALRAGVDSVEHATLVDEEGIRLFKERGVPMVPTLYVMNYILEEGEAIGFPRESIDKARALIEERDRRIGAAFAAGAPVAFGSDTIFPHETAAREFAVMVGIGLSPTDALRSAMTVAARTLGLEDEIGRISPGSRPT